jgi:hypothetical protein
MIYSVLISDVSRDGAERTWRQPLGTRVSLAIGMAALLVLPGLLLALTLATNQVRGGGWLALELAVAAWGILAWRVLVHSVTLTRDTLVIRNIFTTARVPLTGVTEVGFRRGALTVTVAHGPTVSQRFKVSVANLGSTYWSGLRNDADALAEAISCAVGLPPPPPRREIISRNWAWVILVAALACTGFGIYYGPLQNIDGHRSLALGAAGGVLYGLGTGTVGLAFRVARDHRRKRAAGRRRRAEQRDA